MRFDESLEYSFLGVFLIFFLFIFFLFHFRLIVIKIFGLINAVDFTMYQTKMDHYGFRKFDRFSYYKYKVEKRLVKAPAKIAQKTTGVMSQKEIKKAKDYSFTGFYSSLLSLFIFFLSLGFLIFPSMWRFKSERIEHLFVGTMNQNEIQMNWRMPLTITGYRITRALFMGNVAYVLFLFLLKELFFLDQTSLYGWFIFIVLWIAIITLLPIPGTEGYDHWEMSRFSWIFSWVILFIGMSSILVFSSAIYTLLMFVLASIAILMAYFWRKVMVKGEKLETR
jgi:hypothetical protein